MQTETAKPSLVKRIATAADEASAEAATKLLSAPPSGCLYKLKSKDQPGRNKTGNMETPHRIFLDDFREGVSHRQETVKTSKLENAIKDACGFRFR